MWAQFALATERKKVRSRACALEPDRTFSAAVGKFVSLFSSIIRLKIALELDKFDEFNYYYFKSK